MTQSPPDRVFDGMPADAQQRILEHVTRLPDSAESLETTVKREFGKQAERSPLTDEEQLVNRLYGVFKYLSDPHRGKKLWEGLRGENPKVDRNRLVLQLWETLESRCGDLVAKLFGSPAYHRTWLFDWFLDRYDVRRSRQVVGGKGIARNAHLGLLVVMGALFATRRYPALPALPDWMASAYFTAAAVLVVYLGIVLLVASPFQDELDDRLQAVILALQSLVPRLAAAGVVGLVIVASSEELLELVVEIPWKWLLLPLTGGYLYLLLEMARRIHPLPPLRRLALHGFDVWATALAHAMALTLIAERGLRKILDETAPGPFEGQAAFNVAVFVFIIGLVVNLVWAENPVTEPL